MDRIPVIVSPETKAFAEKMGYKSQFFVPKKARMYTNSDGLKVSTTSVFGILPEPAWLAPAKKRVGSEARWEQICKTGMRNGTQVHQFAENYYTGLNLPYDTNPKIDKMIKGFLTFATEEADAIRLIPDEEADNPNKVMAETKFKDNPYGYSGTADLPCDMLRNGEWKRTIADYKTSSKPRIDEDSLHKYKLQTAAYIIAFNDMMRKRGFGPDSYARQGRIIVFTHARVGGRGEDVWVEEDEIVPLWKEYMFYLKIYNEIYEQSKDLISVSIVES